MRISWNHTRNGDRRMAQIMIFNAHDTECVKEDMTPDGVRQLAMQLNEMANDLEKRAQRYQSLLRIENLVMNNCNVDAIKELRSLITLSLLDAKDIIEMMAKFKNRGQ